MRKAKRFLAAVLAFCMVVGTLPAMAPNAAAAEADATASGDLQVYKANYFGAQLTEDAEIVFYNALQDMYNNDEFLAGSVSHEVPVGTGAGKLPSDLLTAYMNGDASVFQMFQNASNAFMMDYSDLFYLDWTKLSVRVGMSGGSWSVHIGNGAYENLYLESAGYTSKAKIEADRAAMEAKVDEIAAEAQEYSTSWDRQVAYVHDTLIENTDYVYRGTTTVPGDSAAGPLLYGEAWCEGYARAFKMVMDALGIPCVLVGGMGLSEAGENGDTLVSPDVDAHMWNYVYMLDGEWYAVDVTYDDQITQSASAAIRQNNLLKGSNEFSACHVENGVFSQQGRTFSYPVISKGNIGEGDGNGEGLKVNVSYYDKQSDSGEWTSYTVMQPSYTVGGTTLYGNKIDGAGHYLYYKPKYVDKEGADYNLYDENTWFPSAFLFSAYDDRTVGTCNSYSGLYTEVGYQFAIADKAPDGLSFPADATILETSEVIYFRDRYQDMRELTPSIIEREPETFTYISESDLTNGKVHVKYTYDMPLKLAEGYSEASLKVSTSLSGPNYSVDNLTWQNTTREGFDGSIYDCCVVEFDFSPDTSYNYSGTTYTFELMGLVSIANDNAPRSGTLTWASSAVNKFPCPYRGSPSELLLNMYPSLVDATYSADLFTDPVGSGLSVGSNNYDLNLTLIASKTSSSDQKEMVDSLEDSLQEEGLSTDNIASVFNLDLSLACLSMRMLVNSTLNDGSVKICIAIPYPEGFDARDIEGVTFEAYHFALDENGNYVPRKLTCNATETGIWVIADSFSPFVVVALDTDENYTAAEKMISGITDSEMAAATVQVTSADGAVDDTQIPEIVALKEGQSCTYTFTPKAGYALEQVIWNGEEQAFTTNDDGSYTVTYAYDDLTQDNNSLHVNFCAESVLKAEEAAGFEVQNPTGFTTYIEYDNALDSLPETSLKEENFSATHMKLGKAITAEMENISGVKLNTEDLKLEAGKTTTLTLTEGSVQGGNTWESTNEGVATVDANGTVTAVAEGISYITVTNTNGYATCKVEVVGDAVIEVTQITLNQTEVTMGVGDEPVELTATLSPENATNTSLEWSNSNPQVAILQDGQIIALSPGTTTLTVQAPSGASASCLVTVTGDEEEEVAVESVTLNAETLSLKVGDTETLTATVTPEDATDKTVTWSSDNTDVATVDDNGTVTAVEAGTAVITAAAGEKTATCTVSVEPAGKTPVTISGVTVEDKTYDGKPAAYTGTPVATADDKTVEIRDYTYTWYDSTDKALNNAPTDAGSYKLVIAVPEDNATYTGSVTLDLTIIPASLADAEVTLSEDHYTYDGTAKEPEVTVKMDERTLVEGTDYTVAYIDNTDAGMASVIVTAVENSNYSDSHTVCFTIDEAEHVHSYGEPVFTWAKDYSSATATFTCEECDDQETVDCSVTSEIIAPTCTEAGKTVYTAAITFEETDYSDEATVEIPATGHSYDEPVFTWDDDYASATATFTCVEGDDEQTVDCSVTSVTTAPTCTETGKTVYTAAVTFEGKDYSDEATVEIPATGHSYTYTDNGDGTHTKSCTAGDDTSTEPHTYEDGVCTLCGAKEPEDHVHSYGKPVFTWSKDYASATATFTCEECDDEQTVDCSVTSVTTDPTCTEAGKTVYTATVTFEDTDYSDEAVVEIPATGHSYTYTDNGDGTHTKSCTAGDDSSVEPHTYADGVCTLCGAKEPEDHVHSYGEPVFNWTADNTCTATFTCVEGDDQQILDCTVTSETTNATSKKDGKIVYTATVEFEGQTYTDTKTVVIPATGSVDPGFNHNYGWMNWLSKWFGGNNKPDQPEEPDVPSEPDEPDQPVEPDEPDEPDQPVEPDEPDQPVEPDEPEQPSKPSSPSHPSILDWIKAIFGFRK